MNTERISGAFAQASREDESIDIAGLLRILWRRAPTIALVVLISISSVVGYSLLQTPLYEASIKILVGQRQESGVPGSLGGDVMGLQNFTQTASGLVNTRPVAEAVVRELDVSTTPESLLGNISVEQTKETQVLEVSYRDPDPASAQRLANAIGEVFSEQVSEVSPSANAITAIVWERAALPDNPVSPDPVRNGLLALAVGLMLGIGLAFLLDYLDDSWRSPEEAEQISGVPTFGVVRRFRAPKIIKEKPNKKGSGPDDSVS